jgi:hypothetical protein
MNNYEIIPFVGIGKAILGSTEEDIKDAFGLPTIIKEEFYGQEEVEENLCRIYVYENHKMDLTFSGEDEFKLSTITVYSSDATVFDVKLIGLEEETFLKIAARLGHGEPKIGDDWIDYKDYDLDSIGLSFWISGGIVENIAIFPEYDESGNIIIWPNTID